jgi:hypothetical protein
MICNFFAFVPALYLRLAQATDERSEASSVALSDLMGHCCSSVQYILIFVSTKECGLCSILRY